MGKFFAALVLGVAIFGVVYWAFFDTGAGTNANLHGTAAAGASNVQEAQLGGDLYPAQPFPEVRLPNAAARPVDPVVISGYLTALDQQDVPSQVPGQILFIGEEVPEGVVQVTGAAPFMAEPYYYASIWGGKRSVAKFYRRFYENQVVGQEQMVGAVEFSKALGAVNEKKAKLVSAHAEERAAKAGAEEADTRYRRALELRRGGGISEQELGEAKLTAVKLEEEFKVKQAAVNVPVEDLNQADILYRQHEIRCKLPYNQAVIKTILRPRGFAVKEQDSVMQIQNLDRLLAEAQLDSSYRDRLRAEMTATIEPSQEQAAVKLLQGHRKEITCVAVTKDIQKPQIVSGGEDGLVCIWSPTFSTPLREMQHPGPVQSVACTPAGADRNLCVVGLGDGSLYLWDLDADGTKPLHVATPDKAHGDAVTSVAFSPDGKFFASGDASGLIKVWVTASPDAERYPFDPAHGVAQTQNGAVTSLAFLPECRLVSASRDQTLCVWKLKEKGAALERSIDGRDGKVSELGVSHDGRYMLFDQGRTLHLLSVKDGKTVKTLQAPGGGTPFETLALFSPDGSLMLTAGAAEGRLQLWHTPTETERGFEVRQFVTPERNPVTCAAFSPAAGQGGHNSFAVAASKANLYVWPVPGKEEISSHRIEHVRLTLISQNLDPGTKQMRIGFEVSNPKGRLLPGRPVTIVID